MDIKEKLSVCVPAYNAEQTIADTLRSILSQSLADFELLVVDNASTDNTVKIVKDFKDPRIKLVINQENVGCGRNLEVCKNKSSGNILFFLSADDLIQKDALLKVYQAFKRSDDIGIVSRPYFWFEESPLKPVRATAQSESDEIISLESPNLKINRIIASFDQISGMAFRKKYMLFAFSSEPFIEIAKMACPMLKVCKAVLLADNIVAVRINANGSMNPAVYRNSPMLAWLGVIQEAFAADEYSLLRKYLVRNFVANNYVGLVQIKVFAGQIKLLREILVLIRLKWDNIFHLQFWFFILLTLLFPGVWLRRLGSQYKKNVNSAFINQEILKGWR